MAIATAVVNEHGNVTGFDFSTGGDNGALGNTGGADYTSAPQVVITGGGWRLQHAGNSVEDNATLGATEGMIILRKNPSGVLTYIKGSNPFQ